MDEVLSSSESYDKLVRISTHTQARQMAMRTGDDYESMISFLKSRLWCRSARGQGRDLPIQNWDPSRCGLIPYVAWTGSNLLRRDWMAAAYRSRLPAHETPAESPTTPPPGGDEWDEESLTSAFDVESPSWQRPARSGAIEDWGGAMSANANERAMHASITAALRAGDAPSAGRHLPPRATQRGRRREPERNLSAAEMMEINSRDSTPVLRASDANPDFRLLSMLRGGLPPPVPATTDDVRSQQLREMAIEVATQAMPEGCVEEVIADIEEWDPCARSFAVEFPDVCQASFDLHAEMADPNMVPVHDAVQEELFSLTEIVARDAGLSDHLRGWLELRAASEEELASEDRPDYIALQAALSMQMPPPKGPEDLSTQMKTLFATWADRVTPRVSQPSRGQNLVAAIARMQKHWVPLRDGYVGESLLAEYSEIVVRDREERLGLAATAAHNRSGLRRSHKSRPSTMRLPDAPVAPEQGMLFDLAP